MSFTANYPANGLTGTGTVLQNVNITEVGGAPIALGQTTMSGSFPVTIASDQSSVMVALGPDTNQATQNLTARDMASTTVLGFDNQNIITGTPTAGSSAGYALNSIAALQCQISGTWTGTIQFERSIDNGVTWNITSGLILGVGLTTSFVTANCTLIFAIQGSSNFRARMVAPSTGTAVVLVRESFVQAGVAIANAIKIVDATANSTNGLTITSPSTAAIATQPAVVVAVSPNNNINVAASKGRALANAPTVTSYSTPITSAAYVTIIASTTSTTNLVELFDSSGVALYFAVGAAASEVNQFVIYPGGNGQVPLAIPAGSRISYKAVSASATGSTAFNVLNLYT